jgi:RHS repeat-associated protein
MSRVGFPPAPKAEPPNRPKNTLHHIADGVNFVVGAPGRVVDKINEGFAKATDGLAKALPCLPAATKGSVAIGLPHAHVAHPPSGPPPVPPTPLPSVGPIKFGTCASVLINGKEAARCGDLGLGYSCCGIPPVYEIMTGSSKVFIGGARAARELDVTFHCKPSTGGAARGAMAAMQKAMKVAMIAGLAAKAVNVIADDIEAANPENSPAMQAAMGMSADVAAAQIENDVVALAMSALMGKDPCTPPGTPGAIAMNTSPNVEIGGFPMPSWMAIAKGLLKLVMGLRSRLGKGQSPSHNRACGRPGEPVDAVTGANVDEFHDYELPGPVPFRWRRYYDSRLSGVASPIGRGFRHEYQRELRRTVEGIDYVTHEGEVVEFPPLEDAREAAHDGLLLRRREDGIWEIHEQGQPTLEFALRGRDLAPLYAVRLGDARLECRYDAAGQLAGFEDGQRRQFRLQHDSEGRITALELAEPGREETRRTLARYDYDAAGRLVQWRDAAGAEASYEYDARGRMTRKTDRRGYSYHYRYDRAGRCVHTYGDDGLFDVRLQYLPEIRSTVATYADGAATTYRYNENGVLTEIVHPDHGITRFKLNDAGQVVEELDPAGNVTQYAYNRWGGHTARVSPLGYVTPPIPRAPNPPNPLAYELPATPLEWEYGHLLDRHGIGTPDLHDPVLLSFPAPIVNSVLGLTGVHGLSKRSETPPATPLVPRPSHDVLGRLVEEMDAAGNAQRWKYDPNGNVLEHRDRDGSTCRYLYTSWNLVRRQISPTGAATDYAYSLRGAVTRVTDPGGTVSEYVYDRKDRLVEVRRHGRVKERYRYDAADNLIEKTAGDGRPLLRFEVRAPNLPAVRRLASGENHYFAYDQRGRLIRAATDEFAVEFAYDRWGRQLKDERDGRGVAHTFQGGDLAATTYLGRFTVTYERPEAGSLVIRDPAGASQRLRRSPNGLISRVLSNGSVDLCHYDRDGRCLHKSQLRPQSFTRPWSRGYRYSPEGDLLTVHDSQHGVTQYQFDGAHRLIGERLPNGSQRAFHYDAAGNLWQQPGLRDVELDPGNRLRRANGDRFVYDDRNHICVREGAGGVTRYEYNSLDMLVRCELDGSAWEAEYDPLGRRVRKAWRNQTREYYWDDFRLAAEVRSGGTVRIYVYVDEVALVPFMFLEYDSLQAEPESGRRYFLFTNQIGTPVRVEDDSGKVVWSARIDPYGRADVADGSTVEMPLRFPCHYHDQETGLHYNRFRYYSPELGRYLQSDPLGTAGGINLYAYCPNPLTTVDLDGLNGCGSKIAAQAAQPFKNKIGKCEECAAHIKAKMQAAGEHGVVIKIVKPTKAKEYDYIYSDSQGKVISTNGEHFGVLANGLVYDNLHPDGLPRDQWLNDFHSRHGIVIESETPF